MQSELLRAQLRGALQAAALPDAARAELMLENINNNSRVALLAGWLLLGILRAVRQVIESHSDINAEDNLKARRRHTRVRILYRIIQSLLLKSVQTSGIDCIHCPIHAAKQTNVFCRFSVNEYLLQSMNCLLNTQMFTCLIPSKNFVMKNTVLRTVGAIICI